MLLFGISTFAVLSTYLSDMVKVMITMMINNDDNDVDDGDGACKVNIVHSTSASGE